MPNGHVLVPRQRLQDLADAAAKGEAVLLLPDELYALLRLLTRDLAALARRVRDGAP